MTIARVCQFIDRSRLSPGAGGIEGHTRRLGPHLRLSVSV